MPGLPSRVSPPERKSMPEIRSVFDVAAWRLCLGCGACACACPKNRVCLVDVPDDGIRPVLFGENCDSCGECLKVCPGLETGHDSAEERSYAFPELFDEFGPVLELWEGYAANPEIRFRGSSGGLATALSLYCLEREGMHAVLHTAADESVPWRNRTVLSRTAEELLRGTGSRYSPASPCEGLDAVETESGPCVFVGKPCDVVGTRKSMNRKAALAEKVGVTIGFFCAGTPSRQGVLDLLASLQVAPSGVGSIRFRGNGWPGMFSVTGNGEPGPICRLGYRQSWGFLQRYRPYRCHLCPDGTAEFADLSCGDPWYRGIPEDEPGHSLVLVRTEKGRSILRGAVESGFAILTRAEPWVLRESQKNLFGKRQAVWGRLAAMRVLGLPTPRLEGFQLFRNWKRLTAAEKLRSILGTARRAVQRRYYRRREFPKYCEETERQSQQSEG